MFSWLSGPSLRFRIALSSQHRQPGFVPTTSVFLLLLFCFGLVYFVLFPGASLEMSIGGPISREG